MITISTAGDDSDSPLGRMREIAYTLPTVSYDGAYRYARSGNGEYVMHEWALTDDQDREDMEVVKTANPAPWHTLEALARRHDSPSMTPVGSGLGSLAVSGCRGKIRLSDLWNGRFAGRMRPLRAG